MPSLKNAFSSRSCSSSPSSPSDSPGKHESKDVNSKPRLTRQRKLRHVSGLELGLQPSNDQLGHLPVSAPGLGSRSPTQLGHRSTAAVPQPLPLPEFNSFLKQNDCSRSPKEGPCRGNGDGREGHPSTSSTGSYNGHQTTGKFTDHVAKKSSESPTYCHRGFHQDLNVESGQDHFRLNIPARSAPNSGFSSPALSPQRFSTVDLFQSYVLVPREFQTSSALEFSVFDRLSGSSSQMPPTRITKSPENSPLHSPTLQSPCRNARSTSSAFEVSVFDRHSGSSSQTLPTRITQSPENSPLHSPTLQSPCRNARSTSSTFQVSVFDRLSGTSQTLPTRITQSPDNSPLHSPTLQSPCRNDRSPTRVAIHSHHTSLPEKSTARPEGNSPANFHPLPLPPGVSKPSHPITIRPIMEKLDGSLMKSHWQKGKLIGRGTFGSVYLATNRETGALCAMKEVDIIPDDPKSAECIRQLEQEIKVLRNLKHPNIVQYYGSEVIEDRFCIYLEYVYPGSINKYVREHCGAVTESVVRNFTRHILSGLAYLHNTKTIHRDIKGANLLVDASGVVKLADFGLAKHLTGLAIDLSLKGSPHWMAPEVLQAVMRKDGKSELAFAVDIWSLGCTVLEMLNGKPPWSELSGVQAMFNVLHKSPPIPETLSSEGKDFLQWCFQRNPADRPSAAILLEHAFLRNSCAQNVVCAQEFSGMKLMDTSHGPRNRTTHVKDLMPILPHAPIRHGKLPCNSECSVRSYLETSDTGATSWYSPRSTLEVLPNVSSPELSSSPRNISNSLLIGAGNNYPYIFSRPHGREIPHL